MEKTTIDLNLIEDTKALRTPLPDWDTLTQLQKEMVIESLSELATKNSNRYVMIYCEDLSEITRLTLNSVQACCAAVTALGMVLKESKYPEIGPVPAWNAVDLGDREYILSSLLAYAQHWFETSAAGREMALYNRAERTANAGKAYLAAAIKLGYIDIEVYAARLAKRISR